MAKVRDLTGQVFGKLTALRPTDERRGSSVVWECACECGNTTLVASTCLVKGDTTSCGCDSHRLKQDLLTAKQAVTTSAARHFWCVRNRATARGYEFGITLEEFTTLRDRPCALCGFEGPNSIDRVDSEKGYTLDNVQPLCRVCQTIKSAFPNEFIKRHITRIYRHLDEDGQLVTYLR